MKEKLDGWKSRRVAYWVHGNELIADVLGCPARLGEELEAVLCSGFGELGLCVRCRQTFEELLHRTRNAVVDFVARGPECVYTSSLAKTSKMMDWLG